MCVGWAHAPKTRGNNKMKKLLILAAMIVAGVAANAASFKWTGANIYGSDGETKFTGTAEIYAYLSTATVEDAVKVADAYVVDGTFKSDAVGTSNGFTYEWGDAIGDKMYNFFFVIEDGGKEFNSATADPSVIKSGIAAATATTTLGFANMATATQTAGNWAAVPEPTSGFLLLLGMAGLALKRKHT